MFLFVLFDTIRDIYTYTRYLYLYAIMWSCSKPILIFDIANQNRVFKVIDEARANNTSDASARRARVRLWAKTNCKPLPPDFVVEGEITDTAGFHPVRI